MKSRSSTLSKTKPEIEAPIPRWKAVLPFVLGAVLFLVVCLCSASTIKPVTMVLAVGVPILTFLCFTQLRDRMGIPPASPGRRGPDGRDLHPVRRVRKIRPL